MCVCACVCVCYFPDNVSAESNQTSHAAAVGRTEFTEVGDSFLFQIVYKNVAFLLVMYVVPLSTLVVVTVRLLATIRTRRSSSKRRCRPTATADPAAARTTPIHGRQQVEIRRRLKAKLVAWHSGRTSVSDWRTFPVLRSTCS